MLLKSNFWRKSGGTYHDECAKGSYLMAPNDGSIKETCQKMPLGVTLWHTALRNPISLKADYIIHYNIVES